MVLIKKKEEKLIQHCLFFRLSLTSYIYFMYPNTNAENMYTALTRTSASSRIMYAIGIRGPVAQTINFSIDSRKYFSFYLSSSGKHVRAI